MPAAFLAPIYLNWICFLQNITAVFCFWAFDFYLCLAFSPAFGTTGLCWKTPRDSKKHTKTQKHLQILKDTCVAKMQWQHRSGVVQLALKLTSLGIPGRDLIYKFKYNYNYKYKVGLQYILHALQLKVTGCAGVRLTTLLVLSGQDRMDSWRYFGQNTRHTMALGWLPYLGIFPVTLPYALVNHAIAQTCLPHLKIFLPPHPRIGQLSYVYMASMSWDFSSNLLSNRTDLLSTAWATLPRMTTIPWEQFPNPKNVTFRLLDINFLVSPEPKSWHSEWATWVVLTLWNKKRRLRRMSQRKL